MKKLRRLGRSRLLVTASALSVAAGLTALPAIAETPTPSPGIPTPSAALADPLQTVKAEAKKQNKRVEIPSYRSEYGTFYANPDGQTVHAEVATRPVWLQAKDGKSWLPVDPTLIEKDGVIQPKAVKGDLTLPPAATPH